MQIEIELSLVINVFLNFLILSLTSLLLKERMRLPLLWALLGACISLISPLFLLNVYFKILLQIFTCLLITSLAYSLTSWKRFFIICGTFVLITFLFGGANYALQNLIGQFPLFVVAIVGSLIYIIVKIIYFNQRKKNNIDKFSYKVIIKDNGKVLQEDGFLDTGNVLYDTITKKPVILITFDVFQKLYSNVSYINAFMKKTQNCSIKNGHYIKINSIGSGTSILIFTVDELLVGDDKSYKNAMLGLSFSGFDKCFGKKILLHSELF